jgi:hypothetical protein
LFSVHSDGNIWSTTDDELLRSPHHLPELIVDDTKMSRSGLSCFIEPLSVSPVPPLSPETSHRGRKRRSITSVTTYAKKNHIRYGGLPKSTGAKWSPTSDIRNNLANIFVDYLNEGNDDTSCLLKSYCTTDVKLAIKFSENCQVKSFFEVFGLVAIDAYVTAMQHSFPDGLLALRTQKLTIFPDGNADLIFTVDFSGSKVFDIITEDGNHSSTFSLQSHLPNQSPPSTITTPPIVSPYLSTTTSISDISASSVSSFTQNNLTQENSHSIAAPVDNILLKIIEAPTSRDCTARVTCLINAEKRIREISILYSRLD